MTSVLVTGGAGFIGVHLVRRLLCAGMQVTVLDNFLEQVHGAGDALPSDIAGSVRLIVGDICDRAAVTEAIAGQDIVVHLAAETGTGQSMYSVRRYETVNIGGTANLIDCLTQSRSHCVRRLVVASSRAIYGEGSYQCPTCGIVYPAARRLPAQQAAGFDPRCPSCGGACTSAPTHEAAPFAPASFYGLTKQVQEQMVLLYASTFGLSAYALRYQNVYGPGQSLTNPYAGILANFYRLACHNRPITIFEDGMESRDFVYIDDAVEATWRAITLTDGASGDPPCAAINVGSGQRTTILAAARQIVAACGSVSSIDVSGAMRAGDIRHNVADLTQAAAVLGYTPAWTFAAGLQRFMDWAGQQPHADDGALPRSLDELRIRGLLRGQLVDIT